MQFITQLTELQLPGPKVIKCFSCSTQLSTKFILLINVKMPTIVGILTFVSMHRSVWTIENSLLFSILVFINSRNFVPSWVWNSFITLGPGLQLRVPNRKIIFLFLNQNVGCGYSKEPSLWDGSFEHPKHMLKILGKKIFTILSRIFLLI